MDVTSPEQARIAEEAGAVAVMYVYFHVLRRFVFVRLFWRDNHKSSGADFCVLENRALERIPADIRVEGGVSRMSDPAMIKGIMDTVTIPVMVCLFELFFPDHTFRSVTRDK